MKKVLLATIAALGVTASSGITHAAPIITSRSPFPVVNLGTGNDMGLIEPTYTSPLNLGGGETATFTGLSGVYSGSTVNLVQSPFAASAQNYLAAQQGGTMTISFTTPQTSFSLLWGTVDIFNSLTITAGSETVTGADVLAAVVGTPGGNDEYITISNLLPFTSIAVTTSITAFEFDPAAIPEPGTMTILGAGLFGVGLARWAASSRNDELLPPKGISASANRRCPSSAAATYSRRPW